ncbi:ATP-dependent DNA helicase PIF1 [Stylophora pistillata]|uniref:ATP-dependent DNA helicase PIF1 n=1 Tax=Stylophora pistillata TaxID=50429 RepID=A0A2B4R5P5_STYPI|nr:ATP-dependent DNA helicase PIF1 [Stylophora pistillata]
MKGFRGKQVLITGEFLQLRPVPSLFDRECFMFESLLFDEVIVHRFELTDVLRQDPNELELLAALKNIHLGCCSDQTLEFFWALERPLPQNINDDVVDIYFRRIPSLLHNINIILRMLLSPPPPAVPNVCNVTQAIPENNDLSCCREKLLHKRNFKVADDDTTEDPADEDFFLAEQNIDDNGCTPLVCSFFETPDLHLYEDQLGETNEDAATDDGTGQVTLYDTVQHATHLISFFHCRKMCIFRSYGVVKRAYDVLLCREILVVEPFKAKPRRSLRGQLWTKIAHALNGLVDPKFSVTQRAVRDRLKKLKEQFLKKMAAEERGSGISPEVSELDTLVEEILDLESAYGECHEEDSCEKKRKELADKENAEDLRLKAMESLKVTQKRKAEADGNENTPKRRSNGSKGFRYLQEKMENDNNFREKQFELRRKELEREEKKEEREEKRHQDMVRMMQMQQQQMQQMHRSMMQAQTQQNQMFMALIEKLSK